MPQMLCTLIVECEHYLDRFFFTAALKAPRVNISEPEKGIIIHGYFRIFVVTYDKYFFSTLFYGEDQQCHKEWSTALNHRDKYAINF